MVDKLLDIILGPKLCPLCETTKIGQNDYFCHVCAKKVKKPEGILEIHTPPLDFSFYLFDYEGFVAKCIRSFKFKGEVSLWGFFNKCITEHTETLKRTFSGYDIIIPVPGKKKDNDTRGYDHVFLIASYLSKILNINIAGDILKRTPSGKHQKFLNSKQRSYNASKNYTINSGKNFKKRKILIVDDVRTTGTTLKHISKGLVHNGAANVAAFTLARTPI